VIPQRTSSRLVGVLAVACMAALLALIARAQITKYARTKNFRWTEYYDRPMSPGNPTNALKVLIRGAEGQYLTNDQWRITTARVEHYPMAGQSTNLIAITPLCFFDPNEHTLSSTDHVDIIARDGAIVVNGSGGFRFETTNSILHVSNHVRTTLQGSLLKSGRLLNP